jgi:hypothetical protein
VRAVEADGGRTGEDARILYEMLTGLRSVSTTGAPSSLDMLLRRITEGIPSVRTLSLRSPEHSTRSSRAAWRSIQPNASRPQVSSQQPWHHLTKLVSLCAGEAGSGGGSVVSVTPTLSNTPFPG